MIRFLLILCISLCFSCEEIHVPKPKAFLSLDYPKANYLESTLDLPFSFETNSLAQLNISKKNNILNDITLRYPTLKASVFISYKKIETKVDTYIADARAMTQKHLQIADEISERKYENVQQHIYGRFYDLKGNVASQSQFYVTDSSNHFLRGALYFNVKPNYDSVRTSLDYIMEDMDRMLETVSWR